jgi:glycosyltransferase involved in cell wall biosynthesis
MKILFLLPEYRISGGVYIVAKAAEILAARGRHDVTVAVPSVDRAQSNTWLRLADAVPVRSHAEARRGTYDIVFATWWQTLLESVRFDARVHALFMQAWESAFYAWGDPEQEKYEFLLDAHAFPSLGTARWMLNYASRPAYYFLAGLDRSLFQPMRPAISRREGRVRFLVEGNITETRKNVRQTLSLVERIGAEYIWVGLDASWAGVGPHCVGVFPDVPLHRMAAVYSSADVLIKLSSSEGMFAPPLEMFACGGTAICWDVQGADEYMLHGYNSLLCPMNNFSSASAAVDALRDDRDVLERLKAGATRTAEGWPSWSDVTGNLLRCVEAIARHENQGQFLRVLEDYAKRFGHAALAVAAGGGSTPSRPSRKGQG